MKSQTHETFPKLDRKNLRGIFGKFMYSSGSLPNVHIDPSENILHTFPTALLCGFPSRPI